MFYLGGVGIVLDFVDFVFFVVVDEFVGDFVEEFVEVG